MSTFHFSTIFFWSFSIFCKLLFWIYLWQLKEYHWGRLRAHLQTVQGRRIIIDPKRQFKLLLFLGIAFFPSYYPLVVAAALLFGLEALFYSYKFARKKVARPSFTKRTVPTLLLGAFVIYVFVLSGWQEFSEKNFFASLLAFDVLSPFIFSFLVLFFQPLVTSWQKDLLKKAKKKMEDFPDLKVVGVTGSYGKSSTKEFLAEILSKRFEVLKTEKNQNSEVGVSTRVLKGLEEKHDVFVAEIGAYEKGKIKQVAEVIEPDIGILTGINEQHLATFGSQQEIFEGKLELLDSLPKEGMAVLNFDDPIIKKNEFLMVNYGFEIRKCSSREKADVWAEEVKVGRGKVVFDLCTKDTDCVECSLQAVGVQNVVNFLMGAAVGLELGVSLEEIAEAGKEVESPESGMKLRKGRRGVTVVDDTYSANPQGVKAALNHLRLWPGRKIVVMPCLIELGRRGQDVHFKIGKKIGKICDLAVITSEDYFKEVKMGALEAGMRERNIVLMRRGEKIFEKLAPLLKKGNVVLLETRVPASLKRALLRQKDE